MQLVGREVAKDAVLLEKELEKDVVAVEKEVVKDVAIVEKAVIKNVVAVEKEVRRAPYCLLRAHAQHCPPRTHARTAGDQGR